MASFSLPTSSKPLSCHKKPTKVRKYPKFAAAQFSSSLKNPSTSSQILSKSWYLQQISSLCKQGLLRGAFSLLNQLDSDQLPIGPEIYGEILQGCVNEGALFEGRQIHARIIKSGPFFHRNEYIGTRILIFYAKCDSLAMAEQLFARQRRPNVFSWAAMIGLHSRQGLCEKALMGFCTMIENGALPDNFVVPNALKACSALRLIRVGRGIHGYVLKLGLGSCVYVSSSLIDFYGKCGVMDDAKKVFEEMLERNVVAWNSMLVELVQNGLDEEALQMFCDMREDGVEPTRVSIASCLSASANLGAVGEGRQGHGVAVLYGLELDNVLGTSIINLYCKVGLVEDAEMIFNLMVDRDTVTWNLLISGYVQAGQTEKVLSACHQMRIEKLKFDSVTLASILSACADAGMVTLGRICHAYCIRNNLDSNLAVASCTIDFYASCEKLECAQRVFSCTISRDLVLWNTLISAYAQYGATGEALKLFYQMQLQGVPANVISWNLVILGFLRSGHVSEAEDMLVEMQITGVKPNSITWATFIFGLVQNGCGYKAMGLFVQMQSAGLRPDVITILGVLLACSSTLSLNYGRTVHAHVIRRGLISSSSVVSSLVDMYAKCGSMKLAQMVFESISHKDRTLLNVMISGYSLHGQAEEALELYKYMHVKGIEPDITTFRGLLSACCNAGLVDEGLKIFTEMVFKYRMTPRKEDSDCLVSLVAGSGGTLKEAFMVLSAMALISTESHVLRSILASCKDIRDIELARYLLEGLLESERTRPVNYTTLASIHAASGKWQRALVQGIGVVNIECSWIQIGNEVHAFDLRDRSHPKIDTMSEALLCLHREMRFVAHPPRT